jgi:hypothetical protein
MKITKNVNTFAWKVSTTPFCGAAFDFLTLNILMSGSIPQPG